MRDLTPILMGDPCTAIRRNPTQAEIERLPYTRWEFRKTARVHAPRKGKPKTSVIWTLKVGDSHLVKTKSQAISMRQRMLNVQMLTRIEVCDEGFLVRRLT